MRRGLCETRVSGGSLSRPTISWTLLNYSSYCVVSDFFQVQWVRDENESGRTRQTTEASVKSTSNGVSCAAFCFLLFFLLFFPFFLLFSLVSFSFFLLFPSPFFFISDSSSLDVSQVWGHSSKKLILANPLRYSYSSWKPCESHVSYTAMLLTCAVRWYRDLQYRTILSDTAPL